MKDERRFLTLSTECYQNPFIPKGFTYVTGTWNTGFVISDDFGNEFVWIPVGWLESNGTLDGISYNSKFGRRNWYDDDFSLEGWNETVPKKVVNSILEWGGFYFACNTASFENGRVVFKAGKLPIIEKSYDQVLEYEASFKTNCDDIEHCIVFGSAYDSICQWIIQSGTKTKSEIIDDSTYLGNYANNDKFYSEDAIEKLLPSGYEKKWAILNINDLAGNVFEFSQERYKDNCIVLRSGQYRINGRDWPVACRFFKEPLSRKVNIAGFRTMLFHK